VMINAIKNDTSRVKKDSVSDAKVWKQLIDSSKRPDVGTSPHQFKIYYFKQPTWCNFCQMFIWGVASPQGYRCEVCKYAAHKRCMPFVAHMCEVE